MGYHALPQTLCVNDVLWPIMHCQEPYFSSDYEGHWRSYIEVNKAFAAEVLPTYVPGDLVVVSDYHLMLVPQLLRAVEPSMRIAWFNHVPFPPE
jgi:trehalose 6-phosphate synthase/phosphatase